MAIRGTEVRASPAKRRALAVGLFAVSLVAMKLCVYDPISAAKQHAETVSFSFRNAALSMFFLVIALILVAVSFVANPDAVTKFNRSMKNPETGRMSPKAIVLAAVLTLLCFGFGFWAQGLIRSYGYDV